MEACSAGISEVLGLLRSQDRLGPHAALTFLSIYRRFSSARSLFRRLLQDIDQRSPPSNQIACLRFLALWLESRYPVDFSFSAGRSTKRSSRINATKVVALLADMRKHAARAPSSVDLLSALSRVQLALVRQLLRTKKPLRGRRGASVANSSSPTDSSTALTSSLSATSLFSDIPSWLLTPSLSRILVGLSSAPVSSLSLAEDDRKARRLMSYSPQAIAEHLTALDFACFSDIQASEFYGKAWENSLCAPHIQAFTARWNSIAQWTSSNILVQKTLASQARVFCGFIRIAKWCHDLGNYSAALAIFNGTSVHVISRLFKCWRENDVKIPSSYKRLYYFLDKLLAAHDNFSNLRTDISLRMKAEKPCVPHVGLFQRDLTLIYEGNQDVGKDGKLNINMLSLVASVLDQVRLHQNRPPPPVTKSLPHLDKMLLRLRCCGDAGEQTSTALHNIAVDRALAQLSERWRPFPKDDASETTELLSSVDDKGADSSASGYDDASGSSFEDLVDVSDYTATSSRSDGPTPRVAGN